MTRSRRIPTAFSLAVAVIVVLGAGASPALAGEAHPFLREFGRSATEAFSNPNGIAIDESTGDVYVADIGTDTVYRFDANGNPVDFSALTSNGLTGAGTPAGSFSFPLTVEDTPAAIAIDNSTNSSDPSRGDLYVMDAGHGVIDKFGQSGEYLSQIAGFKPANPTGSEEEELLGIAVDAQGTVRVDVTSVTTQVTFSPLGGVAVEEFDDSAANHVIAKQFNSSPDDHLSGIPKGQHTDGFAVGPTGDDYMIFGQGGGGSPCSCTAKLGPQLAELGLIDGYESGDVAIAADPASGHLYADDQSTVAEWDNGAINGSKVVPSHGFENYGAGTLVARFGEGQLSSSSGQGGIAVDGLTGEIYVSDPADGKVHVFASDAPAVGAGAPTSITKESATLNGTVNPRGEALSSCQIEYGLADEFGQVAGEHYEHSVVCEPGVAGIGAASSPVAVSLNIKGLQAGLLYRFRIVAANAAGSSQSAGLLATVGPGFGLKSFELSFVNEDGTVDTQAGSHPYELRNNMEFNSHFIRAESNADSMYLREPDGTLRDLAVDLPPGLVGDPNATPKKCTLQELLEGDISASRGACPPESLLGIFEANWDPHVFGYDRFIEPVYNMVAPRGDAAQFGVEYAGTEIFINSSLLAGGNYPIQATVVGAPPEAPVIRTQLTINGVLTPCVRVQPGTGKYTNSSCTATGGEGEFEREAARSKAFLTLPTGCNGPLRTTVSLDSYEEPGHWAHAEALTRNSAGAPVSLTGCSKLIFPPTISVSPDTTNASSSSGLTVGVHVSQTAAQNPDGLAESSLRDTTVALPAGVALNPSGANGLEACSEGLAGFEIGHGVNGSGFEEFNPRSEPGVLTPTFNPTALEELRPGASLCPDGSKIGTVKIKTPLLEHELEGSVYLASQGANPFGSLLAMYLMVEDPISGSTIKLTGEVQLCEAAGQVIEGVSCQGQGQIITTFKNTPDLPFENLELHFFGGERAPLATPMRCGTYTTTAVFTPWDGNGPVTAESSFNIEHGPGGSACPGATLPFNPSVNAGATNIQAGAFSPLTVTVNRKDGEQNLKSLEAKLPPGLSGVLTGVELCPEPQADEGLCGENSKVGEATIGVGIGNDPFTVTGGKFYLTGPYNGHGSCTVGETGCAPFGLTFEVPAKAGPFDLANTKNNHPPCDCVLVRGKIELNPQTAAITITSNPPGSPDSIPTSIEGIPLEIQHVNATTTRGNFQFNPTNCSKMSLTGTVQLNEGGTSTITTPFQVTNCAALKFEPKFSVSTSAKTSRTDGASLSAKLTYPNVPQGTEADIAKVKVELPGQLPSRLTTLQKACTAAQFESNPAACPAASKIGYAVVHTPLIPVPLQGPAIFVSHGGEAFPSLTLVLQGYGITIDLIGTTDIKNGVTSTTFKTVPDQPFSSFELTLPEGPYSALTTAGNLCSLTKTVTVKKKVTVRVHGRKKTITRGVKQTEPATLAMPTEFVAQNGAEIHQDTPIAVTGCPKTAPATKTKAKSKKTKTRSRKHGKR
jgi:hypothetical protein